MSTLSMPSSPVAKILVALFALSLGAACEKKDGEGAAKAGATTETKPSTKAAGSQPAGTAQKMDGDHTMPNGQKMAAANARAFWIMPKAGSKVPESFPIAFGVAGMTVNKAGEALLDKTKGHHHVIVDGKAVPAGTVVAKDATHIHYGGGQTSAVLKLAPGKHTLTMQFADGAHKSYGEKMSATINIEVMKSDKPGKVMFTAPKDGEKIKGLVKMKFAAEGYTIRKAGEDPIEQISGHHHVIVDGKPLAAGTMVPKNETNIHFGGGQKEAELKLAKGKHTLTMQLADGAHLSYGETLSHTITIEVE